MNIFMRVNEKKAFRINISYLVGGHIHVYSSGAGAEGDFFINTFSESIESFAVGFPQ